MASGLGITLGIVAGAVAIGLTAGLAAPALGLVGATAVGGGAVLGIGGAAFSLGAAATVGALALGAGLALTQASQTPDPISQVHRQLGTTDDPEAPWEWVYGEVIKGAFRAWQGVGGNKDKHSGVDDVLACHPCEALLAIQVGDWYLPIVTNNAGDANANGKGLIRNADRTTPYSDVPDDWLVPVPGPNSPFHANDQSQVNNDDTWHIAVRFRPGNQTATQDLMTTIFGTKYSSVARKFTGHTVCHIIFRARTNLGTAGPPPTVLYHLQGKNDIRDHTGIGSEDYRTNAAHIFCDYTREQLGIGPTDYANLQAAANECNDTTWDPQSSAARYTFNGVIRDDMDIHEAMRLIATHMAGGWTERGDKVVLWTGTAKTAWADGPLVPDDFAGPVTILPPDEDSFPNTLTVHTVHRTAQDEDGKTMLYGKMEPTKNDVTSATYVTEDGGEVIKQDIKFQACPLSRRGKYMAWSALKQMRLGASYVRRFKKRAMVLEVGDVVAVTDPDWIPNETLFQVASKSGPDPRDFSVELGLVRFANGIYNPDATVTEDAIGVVPRNRSSTMPEITGLAAVVLEDSVQILADGTVTVDVEVTWDAVDNLLVVSGGDVRIGWKRAHLTWPRKSTTADGDSIQAVLPGFRVGVEYHIRARAEGVPSAGRDGKPVGRWTSNLSFTANLLDLEITGPPASLNRGKTLVSNGSFEQGPTPGNTTPVGWEYESAANGSTTWSAGVGHSGEGRTEISIVTATRRIRPNNLILVTPGERYLFRYWVRSSTTPTDYKALLNVQFYGEDGLSDFIQTDSIENIEFTGVANEWFRLRKAHTVPTGEAVRAMRVQAALQLGTSNDAFGAMVDDVEVSRIYGGRTSFLETQQSTTLSGGGTAWNNIRRAIAGTPGDPISLKCEFYARIGDDGLGSPVTLRWKVIRQAASGTGTETEIKASAAIGDSFGPATPGDWDAWKFYSVTAFDLTGARGNFTYTFQFTTDSVNGKAAVRYRQMAWQIEDEVGTA